MRAAIAILLLPITTLAAAAAASVAIVNPVDAVARRFNLVLNSNENNENESENSNASNDRILLLVWMDRAVAWVVIEVGEVEEVVGADEVVDERNQRHLPPVRVLLLLLVVPILLRQQQHLLLNTGMTNRGRCLVTRNRSILRNTLPSNTRVAAKGTKSLLPRISLPSTGTAMKFQRRHRCKLKKMRTEMLLVPGKMMVRKQRLLPILVLLLEVVLQKRMRRTITQQKRRPHQH
mmetsp:Transcript_25022/g.38287  ORF Transcript_25022/g.38287 Transcript_25022/m.38287 type:complete len:234 (-) Transcript_25022:1275-1976(-)